MGTRISAHEVTKFDTTVRTFCYVHLFHLSILEFDQAGLSPSSPATGLSMSPPAGDGAELQFAFTPFHAPDLGGLNLVFQILCGLDG